jgi:2,5-dioxopentanoate dehydrogenase
MELHGKNFIGKELSGGEKTFKAFNPALGKAIEPAFYLATKEDIRRAVDLADKAFQEYRKKSPEQIANFLDSIANEIMELGDTLVERCVAETGLPTDRIVGERARTVNQLRMFAQLVRDGYWLEASIDTAIPDRKPIPKPDLRRMLIPVGPVVVFSASNFPLAFSVAGGDTASALAAGNTVVVKAHSAHPGTSELVARAITKAVELNGMPDGTFSLVHKSENHDISLDLIRHPLTKAVGFTGSLHAGRILCDVAAARPEPIPVHAEMSSINPVFVLPRLLKEKGDTFAEGLKQSVTLGVGQFCTNPGLVIGLKDENLTKMVDKVTSLIRQAPPATMLYPGILGSYQDGIKRFCGIEGVEINQSQIEADSAKTEASPALFTTDVNTFLNHHELSEEVFGPSTLVVNCTSKTELEQIARNLQGHLTATIHGTQEDIEEFKDLISILETKVGRLIFNGFPTGVEVCASMQHGGPYPATSDSRFTSVGTTAIRRFVRPICYQNAPQEMLPVELQNVNARGIWRLVNNQFTKDNIE